MFSNFWKVFDTIVGSRTWDGEIVALPDELITLRILYIGSSIVAVGLLFMVGGF